MGYVAQLKSMHPCRTEKVGMSSEEEVKEELKENKIAAAKWIERFPVVTESVEANLSINKMVQIAGGDEEIEAESDSQKNQR